jgi:hypothetical protein
MDLRSDQDHNLKKIIFIFKNQDQRSFFEIRQKVKLTAVLRREQLQNKVNKSKVARDETCLLATK